MAADMYFSTNKGRQFHVWIPDGDGITVHINHDKGRGEWVQHDIWLRDYGELKQQVERWENGQMTVYRAPDVPLPWIQHDRWETNCTKDMGWIFSYVVISGYADFFPYGENNKSFFIRLQYNEGRFDIFKMYNGGASNAFIMQIGANETSSEFWVDELKMTLKVYGFDRLVNSRDKMVQCHYNSYWRNR